MKILLKNVGRFFEPAEVEIKGITVLAGENGTGKSTIGKIVYCVYNCFYDYERKIMNERTLSIFNVVRFFLRYKGSPKREYEIVRNRIEELIDLYNENHDITEIYHHISAITGLDINEMSQEMKDRVVEALNSTDEEILDTILERIISQEFGSQLGHVNYGDVPACVQVKIKDHTIDFYRAKGKKAHINNKIRLVKEVVYIEDPYILDDIQGRLYAGGYSHRVNLVTKLKGREKKDFSAIDDVVITKSLEELFAKLSTVCSGELQNNDEGSMSYADENLNEAISLLNLSTGLKSFAILKALLQKGYLERNGILVLDEPEAHLHPEWMKLYAEFVVLLQKVLDINIVLSTHSADFLIFIELYVKKYDINDKCKYYMLNADPNDCSKSVIEDVSENTDRIYAKLSVPFLQASEEFDYLNESE